MRASFGAEAGASIVALSEGGTVLRIERGGPMADALALFDAALAGAKRRAEDVDEILIDRGPGGFSVVRRRVAVAVALAYALGARLAAIGPTTPARAARLPSSRFRASIEVVPKYDRPPNITMSKKPKIKSQKPKARNRGS